jgi:hypothetical protein
MALDPTAREANFRDSIKKYFIDNLYKTERIQLLFDKGLTVPKVQGVTDVDKWVTINFGPMERDFALATVDIICCTRKDSEGFKLAQLSDTVSGYLHDSTQTDGMRKITLYRSYANQAWENIGGMLVQDVQESAQMEADDQTKFKILTCRIMWAVKI